MTAGPPALDVLLLHTATEIRACRAMVIRLEDAVHALVHDGLQPGAALPIRDLQAIDLLDQRLHDLALWTEALAAATPGLRAARNRADLAATLLLAEMREALGGLSAVPAQAGGQTEFF